MWIMIWKALFLGFRNGNGFGTWTSKWHLERNKKKKMENRELNMRCYTLDREMNWIS